MVQILIHGYYVWESARSHVCRILNLQAAPASELQVFKQQLDEAYQRTASNLPHNTAVKIEVAKGRETLTIRNLDKSAEPESYLQLKTFVDSLLPHVDLPEVLLEIQAKIGFMDEFTHVNESFARVNDLSTSICAVLIASVCNIGLTPLVRSDVIVFSTSVNFCCSCTRVLQLGSIPVFCKDGENQSG